MKSKKWKKANEELMLYNKLSINLAENAALFFGKQKTQSGLQVGLLN